MKYFTNLNQRFEKKKPSLSYCNCNNIWIKIAFGYISISIIYIKKHLPLKYKYTEFQITSKTILQ